MRFFPHSEIETEKIRQNDHRLKNGFLQLRQSEVALFDNLYIIIGKTYERDAQSKEQTAVKFRIHLTGDYRIACDDVSAHKAVCYKCDCRSYYNSGYKHYAAHCRRALLFLMPFRSDIKNSLPEFQLVKPRNDRKSENCCDKRGRRSTHNNCSNSVHVFSSPCFIRKSVKIFLTSSRSSNGSFSLPII